MNFPENDYQPLNLYSNFAEAAERFPDTAIYFDQELIGFPELQLATTYAEASAAIINKAHQLNQLGIRAGDNVILYKSPQFDTYLLALAVSYLGAVPAMISFHLPVETMEIIATRLGQPWLLYDQVTAERSTLITTVADHRKIELETLITTAITTTSKHVFLGLDDISYMTHTSGTTGVPKLIAHSAHSMGWRTKWQRSVFDLMGERQLVAFHISPVHSRFNIGISSLMSKGFPMLCLGNGQIEAVANTLKLYRPYALETHPNNFVQWAQLAKQQPALFASINYFHSTFDAINKGTMAHFLHASQAEKPVFMQVYGQSECGPMIMRFHTKESINTLNARNMGVGMPDLTEVRIVDEEGHDLPANQTGNIHMLSKGRALTYFNEDQRFQENTYGPWWDSGDFGYKNEEGELFLLDRQIDLITDVESTLMIEDLLLDKLEFLEEVVIVRGKNDVPQPVIAIHADSQMDWDRWWQMIADFPLLNKPIIQTFEELPRTATMKIQRLTLEKTIKQS